VRTHLHLLIRYCDNLSAQTVSGPAGEAESESAPSGPDTGSQEAKSAAAALPEALRLVAGAAERSREQSDMGQLLSVCGLMSTAVYCREGTAAVVRLRGMAERVAGLALHTALAMKNSESTVRRRCAVACVAARATPASLLSCRSSGP
jgi:hypothetical protein